MNRHSILLLIILLAFEVRPAVSAEKEPLLNDPAPSRVLSVSGDSVIHAGDRLQVEVYREPDLSGAFTVDARGNINYPLLGEIFLDGLSVDEFKEFLTQRLGQDYIVNPQIRIGIEDSPNKSVSILGSVTRPGNYVLGSNMTLVRLVSQVGGFAATASTNNIKVLRPDQSGKKIPMMVDVDKIMAGKQEDFVLQPGDFVYVEQVPVKTAEEKKAVTIEKIVTIMGQVGRPGNYIHTPNMSLVRLVAQAGGFTAVATTQNVRIVRTSPTGTEKVFIVDAGKIMAGRAKDVPVEPGDLIVVQESFF